MRPFLAGFCSELLKTAFEGSSPPPVPATGSPTTQRPTGAAAAPTRPGEGPTTLAPIHQRVGAGVGAPKQDTWRPSPKYTPKPDPKAKDDLAPKPKAGRRTPKPDTGMPWKEVNRPAGSTGGQVQKADPRSQQAQQWGALPKAQDKPLAGDGRWGKDAPRSMAGRGVSDKDWEKMQRSSHLQPGMERQKQTRMGTPDPNQIQKDLHRGSRGWTQQEQFLKDNPIEPTTGMQPMGGGQRSGGQFATAKDLVKKNQMAPMTQSDMDRWNKAEGQ